ncbi:MAG: hypothetical protein BWK80_57085 [Desulfobacteraceae bacterium IS3]|nr:MAG: hypothetical protein BWK80_57085 [Desulfobacteraceae bacterium IS3]
MKIFFMIGICLFSFYTAVHAEIMYIREVEISLRTEPGNDRKVIEMLNAGQSLEVLQSGDTWTNARLPNGKEGWILSRYLTSKKPASASSDTLKKENESLSAQIASLTEENRRLKEGGTGAASQSEGSIKTCDDLSKSYKKLKDECADCLRMKSDYETSSAQIAEEKKKTEDMRKRLADIEKSEKNIWFMTGGGVFLAGIIVGSLLKGQRKRSSLY